ncbi:Nicotinamidase-related amidase [Verrucomicrobium sp. GAS474]|uniref:isochorismatase family protein n=1 Tax=Verrucomicrobium sp. GAS474 TaxID=1882831 RepID=UPI000879EE1A|nr:isochorismatase family protein [Verrucomicrobium sp. GAS474]SDT87801.1 Nicotinamidase-related amidase [Verrucomicrobium sp. GAS474]
MSWRLDPSDLGLVVVDVQERLVPVLHEPARLVKKTASLVALARLFALPLLVSEHVPEKLGPTVPDLGLLPDDRRVLKRTFSAAAALEALGDALPKTLLVCGCETHICVRQTVYDLREGGRTVVLVGDACSSRAPLDHALALDEMRTDKTLITSVEALGWELTGSVDSPRFKAVLALLK